MPVKDSILLIYTGGTIGMIHDPLSGTLRPFNFEHIVDQVPELRRFDFKIDTISFKPLIDSSEVSPRVWIKLAGIIEKNYSSYDGFVILHGTDTMAFSASALSFMLDKLAKPVIFTGSQLPIGTLRTDGKENLITALEIAAAKDGNKAMVPEVCIYFENNLFRGNRTTKQSTEHFNAFASPNCEPLATTGITIKYNQNIILYPTVRQDLSVKKKMDSNVAILKLFPGINKKLVQAILDSGARAVVLESYGAGNAPTKAWFLNLLKNYIKKGGIIVNVTQCNEGSVQSELYETGKKLTELGVISGRDISLESAITRLMYLLGNYGETDKIKKMLNKALKGEITV
ncbi:MAG: asparaginase [Marinilabiliaceae bacterium]|jgi:L-asparaginase|nr:asparaginase [Marinilabiliaceae bacterium]